VPTSSFGRELSVSADQEKTWATLTDVPLLVSWLSVLEQAAELAPLEHYSAVLMDRLGPFKLRADLDIVLSGVVDGRHVAVRAEGEDRQVGSRVVVDAVLDLEPGPEGGSVVRVAGTYEVTGRVASMGSGTIRKKADKILDEFFGHLADGLGAA
jgi:carbon monoxide dehydrogenase subunit G